MRFSFTFLLVLACFTARAQNQEDVLIRDLIEAIAENLPDDYDLSEIQDRLTFYYRHPLDLNRATAEDFKNLFFLSPLQIGNLIAHRKTYGHFIDVLELQSIAGFDMQTIQRLLPFVTLDPTNLQDKLTFNNLYKFGESDLLLRVGRVLEKSKGLSTTQENRYLGSPERLFLRYKYTYANRISAALVLEKDAGEPFKSNTRPIPIDHQAAHVAVYQMGRFKKIVLGDYSLQFGQGLTLWSGFSFGKAPDVASIAKKDLGLTAYNSANEYAFFRGLASTISLSKTIAITPFISFRKLDASLTPDDKGNFTLNNLNETGLHRTPTEIARQKNIDQQVFGAVIQYQKNELNIGALAHHTSFDHEFVTGNQPYRNYYFSGKTLTNWGVNYSYSFRNFYFFGEFGQAVRAGSAYLQGVLISLSPTLATAVFYRNYSRNYTNFFNQATAENSEAMNEKGLYAALNFTPSKKVNFAFYTDYFSFPWLKFRTDAPSSGYEILAQLTYSPTKTFKVMIRYKTELKQQNTDVASAINYLDNIKKDSYRTDVNLKLSKSISAQNRLEISTYQKGAVKTEYGYLYYQDLGYKPAFSKFSGNIRLAYFHTPSFNSRFYVYEDDVLYSFSFGMYNGKGFRSFLNLKYKIAKGIDIWARYACSIFPKATTVGSGLDEINDNKKTDVKLQLRFQF